MYKKAAKLKLRFESKRGLLTVEDLWDLPLTHANGVSLDAVARKVNKQLKVSEEESFVTVKDDASTILELKLSIVKDLIADKLAEKKEAETRVEKKARKEKILAALARKEDETLGSLSADELKKMLEE